MTLGIVTLGGVTLSAVRTGIEITREANDDGIDEPDLSRFALSCAPIGSRFVEKTPVFTAGTGNADSPKPASNAAAAGKEKDVGCEALTGSACEMDVGSIAGLASDLAADFELEFGELDKISAEKPCSPLTLCFGLNFLLAADSFWRSSVPELDMDEASFTPKLESIPNNDEFPGGAGAAAAIAELRVALKRIGIPHAQFGCTPCANRARNDPR